MEPARPPHPRPPDRHWSARRRPPAAALLCLALLAAGPGDAVGQLTVTDNQLWREDDFDAASFGADNLFGFAVASCDFDGDGFADLAIGSPFADVFGVIADAGAVHVAYGGPDGLTLAGHQTLTQPPAGSDPPETDDRFGSSLAAGDFNGDGWCDLAVGGPNEDLEIAVDAGSVQVFSGSGGGLGSSSQVWTQDSPGVEATAETGDLFGHTLAAGDFDGDGFADLAITVAGEDLSAGAVHVLFGTMEGLGAGGSDLLYQGDPEGTAGTREQADFFGRPLAVGHFNDDPFADLAVGAFGEDVGGIENVGWVHVFYGEAVGFEDRVGPVFDQGDLGQAMEEDDRFGVALAAGDFDGDGRDDLAIGSNGEGVGPPGAEVPSAGSAAILYAGPFGLVVAGSQIWTQGSPGVSDQAENGDQFASELAAGDFDGDGRDDLAVGVPLEDFEGGGLMNNGAVHALYGSSMGLSAAGEQFHGQGVWQVGAAEHFDAFGSVLTSGDFDADGVSALVVGVPNEDVSGEHDAGIVGVITGRPWYLIFADGFEAADLSAWSAAVP